MATIFKTKGERQQLRFNVPSAYVSTGELSDSDFPFTNTGITFDLAWSTSPGAVTIDTTGAPYTTQADMASDFQSQIDSAGGGLLVAVVPTTRLGDGQILLFIDNDTADGYVSIANMTSDSYNDLPLPNITVDTSTFDTTVQAQAEGISQPFFPPTNLKPIASELYDIPVGANEVALWVKVTSNDTDGYTNAVNLLVAWTNGVDGYVTDGYFTEFVTDSSLGQAPLTASDFPAGGVFVTSAPIVLQTTSVDGLLDENSGPATSFNAVRLKVPAGATGLYILPFGTSAATGDTAAFPPTISIAVTSETR